MLRISFRVQKEGELNQRIKEGILTAYETGVLYNPDWVLDEAKKQFEKLIHGTCSVDEQGFHADRYAKDSWLNPTEAIEWFRKWFGE